MVNFTKLAATAERLIEASGRSVTFYRYSRSPADAAKPWRGPAAAPVDSFAAICVFVPLSGTDLGSLFGDQPETLVRQVTEFGLVATDSLGGKTLTTTDSLVDGSRSLKIVMVQELKPGSTSLIFALGLQA